MLCPGIQEMRECLLSTFGELTVEVWMLPTHALLLLDLIGFNVFNEIKDAGGCLGLDSDLFILFFHRKIC